MFQPSIEMENGHNDIQMEDNLQMIPFDDENDPEVIARRIKNRERQRRYRARKRQEAERVSISMISHPQTQLNNSGILTHVDQTHSPVDQTQVSDTSAVTRVYSQRNWKKEARTAHLNKQQKSQLNVIASTPSGRNWKAEARNKKRN
ncbi:uncharacterized protein LOC143552773 [Bidens hawaiensis]|uniref:uncharacterized protein LOC143552773 n=1 Tax=Bidens hawaiensis TaxID=980011 RepID=UPI004049F4E1